MTPRERVARLEVLLDRVRRNAGLAREPAPHTSAPPPPGPEDVAVEVARSEPAPVAAVAAPPSPLPQPPSWQPEPGSAVQPRPSSLPPEELSDDDLLEVTTIPPEAEAPATVEEPVVVPDDEEPPISSSRTKVAQTIDEAIASATEAEDEREVPVKTPPPESGPQAAAPLPTGIEAPRIPDVDELEADLTGPPSMGPTAEQLGETIELEPPRGPVLEIDVSAGQPESPAERPPEELEVALPRTQMPSGMYDLPIVPTAPSPPSPTAQVPPVVPAPASGGSGPERAVRPELGGAEVTRVVLGKAPSAATFVDALDRSLGL